MGKKGKKKKGGVPEAGLPWKEGGEEENVYLSGQCETLERELMIKTTAAEEKVRAEMDMRAKVEQMEEDFKAEQQTTYAVTADMARQYKALQEDLIYKINSLETTLTEQKEELDMTNHELRELIRDKDDEIAHKDNTISELKSRMDDMSAEFADMLNTTLKLMRESMAAKLAGDASEEGNKADYAQRLQEYSIKAYSAVSASAKANIAAATGNDG
jgi:chromosome segregation ATPase